MKEKYNVLIEKDQEIGYLQALKVLEDNEVPLV